MPLAPFSTLATMERPLSHSALLVAAGCTSCACRGPLSVDTRHHVDNRSEDQRQRLIEQQVSVRVEDDEFLPRGADPLEDLSCVRQTEQRIITSCQDDDGTDDRPVMDRREIRIEQASQESERIRSTPERVSEELFGCPRLPEDSSDVEVEAEGNWDARRNKRQRLNRPANLLVVRHRRGRRTQVSCVKFRYPLDTLVPVPP
jgi:hypothetical protein